MAPVFLDRLRIEVEEPSLFGLTGTPYPGGLDALAASGLERRVLDNLAVLSPTEAAEVNSIQSALENAIRGETLRYFRQIEEHYLREASPHRARRERHRLEQALGQTNVRPLAEKLLNRGSPTGTRRVPIKSGLDDGVKLR
ncbi:MAG: hypothetical protein U0002_01165 [Thermoanaerobaculia bacterium]